MPFPSSPSIPAKGAFCILLAGGRGKRLHDLTAGTCKPALPFAGGKLIDFTLANVMRSGLPQLLVATQYLSAGLVLHLTTEWRHQFPGGLDIRDGHRLGPDGYRGTADAVRANLAEIDASGADEILVLAADHVAQMDYRALIEDHRASGAKMTSAAGVYVLDRHWLSAVLMSHRDLADLEDVLPEAMQRGLAQIHRPPGGEAAFYWRDVDTLDDYRLALIDFIDPAKAPIALPAPTVKPTRQMLLAAERGSVLLPGARLGYGARVERAIVAPGSYIPDGLAIGVDADEDRRWFRVTGNGTVLVTPAMLDRYGHKRPRLSLIPTLPILSPRTS